MSAEKRELDNLEKQLKDPKTPKATRKKLTEKYRKLTESIKKRGDPPKAPQVALGKGWASKKAIDQGEKPPSLSDAASGLAKAYGSGRGGFDYTSISTEAAGDVDPSYFNYGGSFKHGGSIKKAKKKSKKRKRAALRGHRAELRGG